MPLYDYLTPKLDFKRKFNHRQSFLYKGRLTVRTIRFENFESDYHYESNPESEVRFEIESNLEASQVPNFMFNQSVSDREQQQWSMIIYITTQLKSCATKKCNVCQWNGKAPCVLEVCGNDFLVPIPFPLPLNHSHYHSNTAFPFPFFTITSIPISGSDYI